MKFLVLNDSHIQGKNSRNYIGDYYSDCLKQLDETIELSKDCQFIIHLGDVFDSAVVANTIVDDVVDRIEASMKTWLILPGNHDMIGHNWENSGGTSLAHIFRRSQYIKLLTELEKSNYNIKGYPYYHAIEEDIKNNGLLIKRDMRFTIAATHAFISIKPFRDDVLHVVAKDIKTNFDLVLCSHVHQDTGITQIGNTQFLNIGAWGRLATTEVNHIPKVAIIDTETRKIEIIPLKSARPGNECFDLSKKESLKDNERELEEFISQLKDFKSQELDLVSIISQICKNNEIEKNVRDTILNKLGEVK